MKLNLNIPDFERFSSDQQFVNVVEAKEELIRTAKHYIVARGRKGGSNVAAAIVNAVLYQMKAREE